MVRVLGRGIQNGHLKVYEQLMQLIDVLAAFGPPRDMVHAGGVAVMIPDFPGLVRFDQANR